MGRTSITTVETVSTASFVNLVTDSAIALPIKSTRGPIDRVCTITSVDELVRIFGDEDANDTTKSFAKAKYLIRRGETLQVFKMAKGGTKAQCTVTLREAVAVDVENDTPAVPATTFTLKAAGPGTSYNSLSAKVNRYSNNIFSLEILDGNVVIERYTRLSLQEGSSYYAYNLLADSNVVSLETNSGFEFVSSSSPTTSQFTAGADATDAVDYSVIKSREIPFCILITESLTDTVASGDLSLSDLLKYRKDFVVLISKDSTNIVSLSFSDDELDSYLVRITPTVGVPGLASRDASLAVAQAITNLHRSGLLFKSPGGLEYGILKDVIKVDERLSDDKVGELQEAGINPIVVKLGYGVTLWGNYTSTGDISQITDLATRLLANYLKRTAFRLSQPFIFREHTEYTWNQWKGAIEPVVRDIANVGGLNAYEVICDRTIMSEEDIANGILRGKIIIYPVEHIQQIVVSLFIDQAGISFE